MTAARPILVNGRFLGQPASGVQRFAREILTALDHLLAHDPAVAARLGEPRVIVPLGMAIPDPPAWTRLRIERAGRGEGHLWEQDALAARARGAALLSLCGSGPLLRSRQLLVVHDAHVFTMPDAFARPYRLWHRTMRRLLARRGVRLASVSRFAATELALHLRTDPAAWAILPGGAEHATRLPADPGILARAGLAPRGYLLAVGNQSPNKNLARLIEAHARLPAPGRPDLVLVGATAPGLARAPLAAAQGVVTLGRQPDAALRALYENAEAFVFPSRREGFGLPPLEAMRLGTPVLASRGTAIPEVLGDAAAYFDPDGVASIARAIAAHLALSPEGRRARVEAGLARADAFSWEASARRLADLAADLAAPLAVPLPQGLAAA